MDWLSLAVLLANRSDKPMVLLDGGGRVRLISGELERTFGFDPHEMTGRVYVTTLVPAAAQETTRRAFKHALRGALTRHNHEVKARDGRHFDLSLSLAPVGSGRDQGLVLTVEQMVARPEGPVVENGRDHEYVVFVSLDRFGELERIIYPGRTESCSGTRRHCFTVFGGRSAPCTDCPILRSGEAAWPRISVRRMASRDGFVVASAAPVDDRSARVTVRYISDAVLVAIQRSRIRRMADRARLTPREREILGYLVDGNDFDDIASALGLSRRTIKFHQSNLLQKLGADSRTDLIRLLSY